MDPKDYPAGGLFASGDLKRDLEALNAREDPNVLTDRLGHALRYVREWLRYAPGWRDGKALTKNLRELRRILEGYYDAMNEPAAPHPYDPHPTLAECRCGKGPEDPVHRETVTGSGAEPTGEVDTGDPGPSERALQNYARHRARTVQYVWAPVTTMTNDPRATPPIAGYTAPEGWQVDQVLPAFASNGAGVVIVMRPEANV